MIIGSQSRSASANARLFGPDQLMKISIIAVFSFPNLFAVAAVLTSSAISALHPRSVATIGAFSLLLRIINRREFSLCNPAQDELLAFLLLASDALRIAQPARRDGFSFHVS
jgi:hypothetical protein